MSSELRQLQQELQDIDKARSCPDCGKRGHFSGTDHNSGVARIKCRNPKCKRVSFSGGQPLGIAVLYRAIQFHIFQICRIQGMTLADTAKMAGIAYYCAAWWSSSVGRNETRRLPVSLKEARALISRNMANPRQAQARLKPHARAKAAVPSTPAIDLLQAELRRLPKPDKECPHCGSGKVRQFARLRYRFKCSNCGREIATDQPVGYNAYQRGIQAKIVELYIREGATVRYGLGQSGLGAGAWRHYNKGAEVPLAELRKAFLQAKAALAAAEAPRAEQAKAFQQVADADVAPPLPLDLLPDEPEETGVTWDVFTAEHRGHQVTVARREDVMVRWTNPNRAVWIADGQCQGVTQQAIRIAKSIAHSRAGSA